MDRTDDEAALCRALLPRMEAFCRRRFRDRHAALDVAQEAMVIVLEALREGRLRDRAKISAYALSTCRAVMIDERRTVRRRDDLFAREPREDSTAPDESGVDRERLLRCLAALDTRERHVIRLTFWEQRSSRDIADALGTTDGNARVLRHRALTSLHLCVQGKESDQ